MTISDRIFDKLAELRMTQKEFSKRTGIPESTISDWRKKQTNPTADKLLLVCKTLSVTPEWLLSGIEPQGTRGNPAELYVVEAGTDSGRLLSVFSSMDRNRQERLLGYAEALSQMKKEI